MANMKFTPADELIDDVWGKVGTPERDAMEAQLKEDMQAYFVGEAIKKARLKQNLTQEELGKRLGVKRSQICKLESGKKFYYPFHDEQGVSSFGHCNGYARFGYRRKGRVVVA